MKTIKIVLLAVAAILFLCSFGGCGNVTADPATEASAQGGSGGPSAPDGGAPAPGTGGSPGTGGNAAPGAGGASGGGSGTGGADAGGGSIPCPPSVPLSTCPAGSVLAGDGGTCPAGTKLVAVFGLCVPNGFGS